MSLWKSPCQSCPPPQGLDSCGVALMCVLLQMVLGLLGVEFSSWHQLCARRDSLCTCTDILRLHLEAGPRKLSSATGSAAVKFYWPWLEKPARSSVTTQGFAAGNLLVSVCLSVSLSSQQWSPAMLSLSKTNSVSDISTSFSKLFSRPEIG